MTAVPVTKGRQIGEILLELGFASEQDIARATAEHERTGQPLGQILVDLGSITRLELASASPSSGPIRARPSSSFRSPIRPRRPSALPSLTTTTISTRLGCRTQWPSSRNA